MEMSIAIDAGSRFQCVPECGFCCGFWDISIDTERREQLVKLDWVQTIAGDLKARTGQPLFPIVGQKSHSIIQRQHGTCSFIDDQKLCSIHAHEGMEAKPLSCQQYPFIYYRTPRGIEVLLDHSCPEVIKNAGDIVTVEEVAQHLSQQFVLTVPEVFPLTLKSKLNWDAYVHLEAALLDVLKLDLSPSDQILCLNQVAGEVGRKLEVNGSTDEVLVKQTLDAFTAEKLRAILEAARKVGGSVSKRDLYLAILIQLVEATYSRRLGDGEKGQGAMFLRILKQWKGLGTEDFKVFKLRVNHSQLRKIRVDHRLAEVREVTARYLRYLVRSLLNTGRMPIVKRLAIVSANYALVDWLSRAHACQNGRVEAQVVDLVFGIQNVEKFVSNRLFNELASQGNFLAKLVHSMFDNPAIFTTMLLEE